MSESENFTEISSRLLTLAEARKAAGDEPGRVALVELAAKVELESPELQRCWGGPLNGQEGRRALFLDLMRRVPFDAIFETGTYRGLSTAWFAENFSGSIYSCEKEQLYYLQAKENLKKNPNVHLSLSDSRAFLFASVGEMANRNGFFYLDAHWGSDLPLREEIEIILNSDCRSVIAIDDFRVPGDEYAFDDYGPERRLSIEILQFLEDSQYRIYFPTLRAADETGAARGVCVITSRHVDALDQSPLLAGGHWRTWSQRQIEYDAMRRQRGAVGHQDRMNEENGEAEKMIENLKNLQSMAEENSAVLKEMRDLAHGQREAALALVAEVHELNHAQELGRQLVEQRARVLQLERQNYILQEELEELRGGGGQFALPRQGEMRKMEGLVQGLSRSRALKLLALIAPGPKKDVDSLLGHFNQLR